MHITPAHISLDRLPSDKIAAIAQAAAIFVDNGCVEEPFRYGMIAREAMGNTYLGHGIAVPHGVEQTERYIVKNSVAFIRAEAGGIPWGPQAERVDTVIAVAAKNDDYLVFLRHLTHLINTPEHLATLKESEDADAIIALLTQAIEEAAEATPPVAEPEENALHQQTFVFPHPQGLHLHPASTLSELAKTLNAAVRLQNENGKTANAERIPELLSLGISHGQTLTISAHTPEAVETVIAHLRQKPEKPQEELLPPETRTSTPSNKLQWIIGIAILLALFFYLLLR